MSSNIGPEAQAKYAEFLDAKTLEDKIRLLTEFISLIPKHKATEKIVALNKTRLKKLQDELAEELERRKIQISGAVDPFSLKKDSNQIMVALVSDFNEHGDGAGKSKLLQYLTGVSDAIPGKYTAVPVIGTYIWNHVRYQLVEIPALQNSQNIRRIMQAIRLTDYILILVDLTRDPLVQMQRMLELFKTYNIILNREKPNVEYKRTGSGGTQIIYNSNRAKLSQKYEENIRTYASLLGKNIIIKINDYVTPLDIKFAFTQSLVFKKASLVGTKADLPNIQENFVNLILNYGSGENCLQGFEKEKFERLLDKFGKTQEWKKRLEQIKLKDEKFFEDQNEAKINGQNQISEYSNESLKLGISESLNQSIELSTEQSSEIRNVENQQTEDSKLDTPYSQSQIDDYSFMGEMTGTIPDLERPPQMEKEEEYTPLFEIYPCGFVWNEEGKEIKKGLQNFAENILKQLKLIRVYTKSKNGVDERPMILQEGSTVETIAKKIHKDLVASFRFAFIYRESDTHKKKRVGLTYELKDEDVIEIFA